jgi:predicted transcriptional regulator
MFKQRQTVFDKQTPFKAVLNTVETDVQTALLENLSATERAIVFVLLNSDMKLSYADLAAMLGKRRATIRGQINSIRQKSAGLIEEIIGENSKKRIYIPDRIKKTLVKNGKVKIKEKESIKEESEEEEEIDSD